MSPLLGHILAQVVSLGVGDRTEGRYINSDYGKYYEAATYVRAGVNVGWKHSELSVGYAPSFTVTPLDSSSRQLLTYNVAGVAGTYHWERTTVSVSEGFGIGQLNFVSQGLSDPRAQSPAASTPGATPGTGKPTPGGTTPPTTGNQGSGANMPTSPNQGANSIRALNEVVKFFNSVTALNVTQKISPVFTLTGGIGYQVSGGFGSSASPAYPIIRGPFAQVSADYLFNRRDTASSLFSAREGVVEGGNESWVFSLWESWRHTFSKNTNSLLGTGVSATRTSQPDGLVAWTIYPTFTSAFNHVINIDHSVLTIMLTASSSPFIDPIRATVDPRLSLGAGAGWTVGKFYSTLFSSTDLSLVDANKSGSLSSAAGSLIVGYNLSPAVAVNSGARMLWQNYEGTAVVPLTWAAFLGLTVSATTAPR